MEEPHQDSERQTLRQLEAENAALRAELDRIAENRSRRWKAGWWFTRKAGGAFAGSWLRNSFLRLYQEIPQKQVREETLADLSASLLWRITRFGVIAIMLALLPTAILLFQTNLLMRQNKLLERQNFRLDQQTNLAEAERRSALVYVMSSIMDQMDSEINRNEGRLSDATIARIASLTQSLKPYRFLENDQLIVRPLSPEKGQLFLNIVFAEMNRNARNDLFQKANFTYSDLRDAELNLIRVQEARLSDARFTNARLFNSDWEGTELSGSDFTRSWVEGSGFVNSDLSATKHTQAAWFGVVFDKSNLSEADFSGAVLHEVRFTDTRLDGSIWRDAVLSDGLFTGSTDLSAANWEGALVEEGWLDKMISGKVKGAEQLAKDYKPGPKVDLSSQNPQMARFKARNEGKDFYRLVRK